MNNIFTRRKYYSYHNRVKQNMLNQYKGDLLDIGSGIGGNIYKWK